jgi:hypothetical protein
VAQLKEWEMFEVGRIRKMNIRRVTYSLSVAHRLCQNATTRLDVELWMYSNDAVKDIHVEVFALEINVFGLPWVLRLVWIFLTLQHHGNGFALIRIEVCRDARYGTM